MWPYVALHAPPHENRKLRVIFETAGPHAEPKEMPIESLLVPLLQVCHSGNATSSLAGLERDSWPLVVQILVTVHWTAGQTLVCLWLCALTYLWNDP